MYHPYLRGKQNELILLRENANLIACSSITPIIEPVKKNLTPFNKAINSLIVENAEFIIIVNPKHGDFKLNPAPLIENIEENISGYENFSIAYIIDANSTPSQIENFLNENEHKSIAFIHNGFSSSKELASILNTYDNIEKHIFMDNQKIYQRPFKRENVKRILIRDGFKKRDSNIEYPNNESFSELHLTYTDEGMDGFGDFLINGNNYSETGGPAYNVAIHLTYLNEDEIMDVRHFLSNKEEVPTPKDPAGKFSEALEKLINATEKEGSLILKSKAYEKFKELHRTEHFPGLGVVKKISMQHHLELLSKFILDNR